MFLRLGMKRTLTILILSPTLPVNSTSPPLDWDQRTVSEAHCATHHTIERGEFLYSLDHVA
jgi:hypothetical protein